jgi:hypothetical protein
VWLHLSFKKGLHTLPLTVAGLMLVVSLGSVYAADKFGGLGPEITIPQSSGSQCVIPSDEMRRRHPDLLKHDRILTVREGVREQSDGKPLAGSLKACINCHAIKDDKSQYVRIDNGQHFCVSCHKYAAVSIDCFQCHRDIPEENSNFHALAAHKLPASKHVDYTNVVPGTYSVTLDDMANIAPEVNSDDN